ncbi:MAG: DUF87 domain-containing protein [Caldilineaceae bacterium]
MTSINLFPDEQIIGVFRGFREGGLEFHADLALPYRNDFQSIAMHGQFVLIQLETPDEAVLGRIVAMSSDGKLAAGSGEEFNIRMVRERRAVPEDLREQYLKYRVNIRVLGVLRKTRGESLTFVPSHRRLPHVGSPVAFPSDDVLKEIAGHNFVGASIGHFALGEYIYATGSKEVKVEDWMQIKSPEILIKFPIQNLVSRRTFIFARAGFGKSNLNKLLFSKLYQTTPTVIKRGGREVPVGTVLFDPDGEYFWPDDKNRPGLCDVPALAEQLVIFTSRQPPSDFYGSFVAGGIKLDIRRLRPADVIAIAIGQDRQDQQNVRKLRSLKSADWGKLVDLIDKQGFQADLGIVASLIGLEDAQKQEAEALAARSNMVTIVRMLHDKSSQLMDMLLEALSKGKLCVVDISQMRGGQSLLLSGLILRYIFDRNQEQFTAAEPKTIPTIAVVEEAQAVLNENATASEPYIAWVKEGRKYDLGVVLVTQQPGSIPNEILSQGDNWFIFHLLSASDLANVKRANAHFSEDLLGSLLNEPIPGQGVAWSSASKAPYPIAIRALSFENMYQVQDPSYKRSAANIYALKLRSEFEKAIAETSDEGTSNIPEEESDLPMEDDENKEEGGTDVLALVKRQAVQALRNNQEMMDRIYTEGVRWGEVQSFLIRQLPKTIKDSGQVIYDNMRDILTQVFGSRGPQGWDTRGGKGNTIIVANRRQ